MTLLKAIKTTDKKFSHTLGIDCLMYNRQTAKDERNVNTNIIVIA